MTLGNMRKLGVRSLAVTCELCHHEATLPADCWDDAILIRAFGPRMESSAARMPALLGRAERSSLKAA